ncbi:MAG: M3 family metallopeptidase [Pseudomarimonas sp.]
MNAPIASNPLLVDADLPAFSLIAAEHVGPAIDTLLAQFRAAVPALTDDRQPPSFERLLAPLEALEERVASAWSPIGHLHGVNDSPALREAYAAAQEKLTDHATELGQNRALFEAVLAVRDSAEFAGLDRAQQALVEDSLRGFRLSGVALEEPARSRFKDIQNELSRLETDFGVAVLDATDAWTRAVEADELAGLPDSALAMLRAAAVEKNSERPLATLKGPVVQAILTYAQHRPLREEVYTASQTRASDQGPQAGQFDNAERIEQIMRLRHESAQLLGFASAAHLSLDDKMAATPERVLGFLRELVAKAKPIAQRELDELQGFASAELGIEKLAPWDIAFAAEKLREKRFDFCEEDLKPYFPLPAVLHGLLDITGRLFGVQFRARTDVDLWHADAQYFDVLDADGSVRAGFFIDHYARTGKRGGAWMDVCRTRFRKDGELHVPVAYLVCNFAAPSLEASGEIKPALLTHDDVLTLFHEFGHGFHHMLTEVDWPSVGGIAGVEWDAVELPSQMLENFAWDEKTLPVLSRHWQTGEALPTELFEKVLAARHFHAGLYLLRQIEFALLDFRMHLEYDPTQGARTMEMLGEVRREVSVLQPPAWNRFPMAFTHVFSGGYAAGYYSYLWAEVLSADAFAAFSEAGAESAEGVLDADTGARFRREVLAVGGSRPALESFVAFRGREPQPDALLLSYGLG